MVCNHPVTTGRLYPKIDNLQKGMYFVTSHKKCSTRICLCENTMSRHMVSYAENRKLVHQGKLNNINNNNKYMQAMQPKINVIT